MSTTRQWQRHLNYLKQALVVAERSTCVRRKVGCLAVKNDRQIATGFNGTVRKHTHCTPTSCIRQVNNIPSGTALDKCLAIHAEQNVIIQAATDNVSIAGASIYCTTLPCSICLNMLLNCRVKDIYFLETYNNEMIELLLSKEAEAWGNERIPLYWVKADPNLPSYIDFIKCINPLNLGEKYGSTY